MRKLESWRAASALTPKRAIQHAIGRALGVQISLAKYHPRRPLAKPSVAEWLGIDAWRECLELQYALYDTLNRRVVVLHDAGLYSCLLAALWSLSDLLAAGHVARSVSFRWNMAAYKNASEDDPGPALFRPPANPVSLITLQERACGMVGRHDHHRPYADYDCELYRALIDTYFKPSAAVEDRIATFHRRYLVEGAPYVGIWFRGTDKAGEVVPTDSAHFVDLARRLLEESQAARVLIQTDQQQVYEVFKRVFGSRCDAFAAMPRTTGQRAIHLDKSRGVDRLDEARDLIAAAHLISRMEHVVTYTGNIGAWLAMSRGHCHSVWQARGGGLVPQWGTPAER
jgi:hypothetical protein